MSLADIHSRVSEEVKRGTKFDSSIIPSRVAQAVKWIERSHTFKHMERFKAFTIDSDATTPRAISVPSGFKAFGEYGFLRILKSNNEFKFLTGIAPRQQTAIETATPEAFWMDGMDYFWLDNTPDEDYNAEISYVAYTTLPSDTSDSAWILDNMEDLIIAESMLLLAPKLELSEKGIKLWSKNRDDGLRSAILADEETRRTSDTDSEMVYGWEVAEDMDFGDDS